MGNRCLLANDRNLLAAAGTTLTPSSVKSASNTILAGRVVRTGSGSATLTGDYTGTANATYEVIITDLDSDDNPIISTPVASGPGSGIVTDITATGLPSQTITLDLLSISPPSTAAAATLVDGVQVRVREAGEAGNDWTLTVDRSDLVFTTSDYSVLVELAAGTETIDAVTGGALEWDCAVAGPDGLVPDTAKRIVFGDARNIIYVMWKTYTPTGWRYYFDPPLAATVPAGTAVLFVTGTYSVTVSDGTDTETYDDLVTLYDLLRELRNSAYLEVVGVIANDRTVGGQALRDLPLRTDATVIANSGTGSKYATGFTDMVVGDTANTEILTATCWAVTSKDHPDAALGRELWTLYGSVSGLITDRLITNQLFTSTVVTDPGPPPVVETEFQLLVPEKVPPGYAEQRGQFVVSAIDYQAVDGRTVYPTICVNQRVLGIKSEPKTLELVYTQRKSSLCRTCQGATVQGELIPKLLGLESITVDPGPLDLAVTQAEYVALLTDLAEAAQLNTYGKSLPLGAFDTLNERFYTYIPNWNGDSLQYQSFYEKTVFDKLVLITKDGNVAGPIHQGLFATSHEATLFRNALSGSFSAVFYDPDWKIEFVPTDAFWSAVLLFAPNGAAQDLQTMNVYTVAQGTTTSWDDLTFATEQDALDWIETIFGPFGTMPLYGQRTIDLRQDTTTPSSTARVYFHSEAIRDEYIPPIEPVEIGGNWYLQVTIGADPEAEVWAEMSVDVPGYTTDGPVANTNYLIQWPGGDLTQPYFIEARPVFASEAEAQDFLDTWLNTIVYVSDSPTILDKRNPLPPYTPFITVVDEVYGLLSLATSSPIALEAWLAIWSTILTDGQDIVEGTLNGYDPTIRSRYADDLDALQDLLYDGADVWKDHGSGHYWIINGGEYLFAETNYVYHSAFLNTYGFPRPAQEFAFVVEVADGCIEYLEEGDKITLTIGGGQPSTYQVGDTLTLSLVAAMPLPLSGGTDGTDTQEWAITGSVSGPFPRYTYVGSAPVPYNQSGLSFELSQGALPFGDGSKIVFAIEGGHFKWRKDGGAWSADTAIDIDPISLSSGLSLTLTTGATPSFAVNDAWSWTVYQPYAATAVQVPNSLCWEWSGSSANLVFDLGSAQTITALAMARHTLPVGATVIFQGGTTPGVYTWSQALTVRAGVTVILIADKSSRYVRVSLTAATGGRIGWLWAGQPLAPSISGDLTISPRWRLLRADEEFNTLGNYLGYGVDGTLVYPLGALSQTDYAALLAFITALKQGGDLPFILVPHTTNPEDAVLMQIGDDVIDVSDYLDYGGVSPTYRAYGLTLPLRGWVY